MKTSLYTGAILSLALVATPFLADAQTSNPAYQTLYSYPAGSCVTLTAYQQLGSTDYRTNGQVTVLQQFLNRTGYLNGVSGVFDAGTYGAVVNFQRGHGILPTGTVGPVTRAAINQQNCSGSTYSQYPNTYQAPSLNSFSVSSAVPGSSVTLYGSNLGANNPIVHFGGSTVTASYSTNSALTFSVPYLSAGTYQVYVTSAYGTSNSMSFTILNGSSSNNGNGNCAWYGNTYQCGCPAAYNYNGYNYSNGCSSTGNTNNSGTWFGTDNQPRISSISGLGSVSTGSSNTWSASAYSMNSLPVSVRVDWGDGTAQQSSQGGSGTQLYPFSHSYSTPGQYTIRFTATDSNGAFAYSTMQVSAYGSSYVSNNGNQYYPSISSLSSTSAYRGSNVTIYGSNFSTNMTVTLSNSSGSYGYATGNSFANGTSFTFTVPYINTGTYNLSVTNSSGQGSNSMTFTVY